MNKLSQKFLLIASLLLPILVLLILVAYHMIINNLAPKVIVPINAYDPRSFLSGHYLVFTLTDAQNSTSFQCPKSKQTTRPANACWMQSEKGWQVKVLETTQDNQACEFILKGYCSGKAFYHDPMQLFIPEAYVSQIGDAVNQHRASIELLVKKHDELSPRRLLIDGKPWQSVIK